MPDVRIGKGARLRRTIVEEGVSVPAGFRAGFDLEQDRSHHKVTGSGVVVVSHIPESASATILSFAPRVAALRATPPKALPDEVTSEIRVLFVDDNEDIRSMMKSYLEVQRFAVITASNGVEGLSAFQNNEDISVVVTDLNMPLMNGSDMIQQILKLNPAIKIIVASSDFQLADNGIQARVDVLLAKPYAPHDLAIAVRAAL